MKEKTTLDQIWNAFAGIFIRLNLTEHGNRKLSLTNLVVWVCAVKIAIIPHASLFDLSALILALFNYAHKRSVSAKIASKESEKLPNAKDFQDDLKNLKNIVEAQSKQLEEQAKVVEEAKSIMTAQKVSAAVKPRQL